MGSSAYVDFWTITADAFDFASAKMGLQVSAPDRQRALDGWLHLNSYAEVDEVLDRLQRAAYRCAILSNGSPAMLQSVVKANGLAARFEAVLSADAVRVFKPDARVYRLVTDTLGVSATDVLFVSGNGWDAAGARTFGFPVAWVNRAGAPVEQLGVSPDLIVSDLAALARELTRAA